MTESEAIKKRGPKDDNYESQRVRNAHDVMTGIR